MTLVGEYTTCKRCGFTEALWEGNSHTREYYELCPMCGYYFSFYALWDSEKGEYKLTRKGNLIHRKKTILSEGAYHIKQINGCGEFGTVDKITPEIVKDFENLLNDPDLEGVFLTRWDVDNQRVVILVGDLSILSHNQERIPLLAIEGALNE